MRQTWEEIGLDLAERDFICVGQLDDREITTSLGKRLLMILSPFGTIFKPKQIIWILSRFLIHPLPNSLPATFTHTSRRRSSRGNHVALASDFLLARSKMVDRFS
jgi:hypothetical protein